MTAGVAERFGVAGRLALVTGASSGLGSHLARLLASAAGAAMTGASPAVDGGHLVSSL